MSKTAIIRFLVLRSIGNFLLLFAIFGFIATFGPALYYEVQFQIIKLRGVTFAVEDPNQTPLRQGSAGQATPLGQLVERRRARANDQQPSGLASIIAGPKQQILIPKDTQFSIVIPKIGATAQVFPNIDPTNESEYQQVLQHGVAHAKGTVFPGQLGNSYFFAHSADNFWDAGRYNAIFYLLKDLAPGDEVVVFFEGVRHNYTVSESKIVDPEDVSYLINSQNPREQNLVLQTCWPPGTTWKRLIVIARPK